MGAHGRYDRVSYLGFHAGSAGMVIRLVARGDSRVRCLEGARVLGFGHLACCVERLQVLSGLTVAEVP